MRLRSPLGVLASALLAALATGCSGSEDLGPLGDPTAAQHRIDSLIDGTIKAITPAVTFRQDIGFSYNDGVNVFGNENGYAKVWRTSYLEERVSEEKTPVLLAQVEKYWKDQGCTVDVGKPEQVAAATCADKATVKVQVSDSGVATVRAQVDKTKFRGGADPFPAPRPSRPTASETPAGQQDDPYWSH